LTLHCRTTSAFFRRRPDSSIGLEDACPTVTEPILKASSAEGGRAEREPGKFFIFPSQMNYVIKKHRFIKKIHPYHRRYIL